MKHDTTGTGALGTGAKERDRWRARILRALSELRESELTVRREAVYGNGNTPTEH